MSEIKCSNLVDENNFDEGIFSNITDKKKREAQIKLYKYLKSKVDAPWIPADDALRKNIRLYRSIYPRSEKYDYLMGRFFERRGDLNRAKRYAFIGLRRRRLDYSLLELMGTIFLKQGEYEKAAACYGRMLAKKADKKNRHWMILDNQELNADSRTKAHIERLFTLVEKNNPELLENCVDEVGRVIITERAKYGGRQKLVYNKGNFSIADLTDGKMHGIKSENDIFYAGTSRHGVPSTEYWKGTLWKDYEVAYDEEFILPLMVIDKDTEIVIDYRGRTVRYTNNAVHRFPPSNWQYLRLSGKCRIQSNREFMVGAPVVLKAPFKRRKLVLNLLVDGLSMEEIQGKMSQYMPNTYRFFQKGAIFRHVYGTNDWTHPCTPTIFYGLDFKRSQIYHPRINIKQITGYSNIPEEFHNQGYLCVNYSSDIPRGLADDVYRGYDIHKTIGNNSEAYVIDAIHLIQQMSTNIFLNIHFMDVHEAHFQHTQDWTLEIDTLGIPYERVMASDMLVTGNPCLTYSEKDEGRLAVYIHEIQEMDRKLEIIYNFLEKNYNEEEYFIVLHSDHGGLRTGITNRHHSHTCLMVRGDGVSHEGTVDDEVISAIDWFSIYAHFCEFKPKLSRDSHLPKVFGGEGRKYAISHQFYPYQVYALALNDMEYEFCMVTKREVAYDGKIDLSDVEGHLYHHIDGRREEVFDRKLLDKYFALAYKEAQYFDEPDEVDYDNVFTNFPNESPKIKIRVSVVLDGRRGNDISTSLHSFGEQNFQGMELKILLSEAEVQDFKENNPDIQKDGRVVICSVGEDFPWHTFWRGLSGEYVLILSGDEILAPTAVEALYHSAVTAGADVVENTCILTNAGEVRKFPQDIYDKMMHPVEGGFLPWSPVKLEGTISSRYKVMSETSGPVRSGTLLIRREFFSRSGFGALGVYGGIELLTYELLYRAEKYLRISAPTHAYGLSKVEVNAEQCIRSLLAAQGDLEKMIAKVPFLKDKSDWQDNIRESFFQKVELRYMKEQPTKIWENAFAKVLSENPKISSWMVKYLFGRVAGK